MNKDMEIIKKQSNRHSRVKKYKDQNEIHPREGQQQIEQTEEESTKLMIE
jgi:hypothetical protein